MQKLIILSNELTNAKDFNEAVTIAEKLSSNLKIGLKNSSEKLIDKKKFVRKRNSWWNQTIQQCHLNVCRAYKNYLNALNNKL